MASIQRRELRRERIAERKRMRRRRNHPAPDSGFQAQREGVLREEESDDDEGEQTQVNVRNDIEDVSMESPSMKDGTTSPRDLLPSKKGATEEDSVLCPPEQRDGDFVGVDRGECGARHNNLH